MEISHLWAVHHNTGMLIDKQMECASSASPVTVNNNTNTGNSHRMFIAALSLFEDVLINPKIFVKSQV